MDAIGTVMESLNQYSGYIFIVLAIWCFIITVYSTGLSKRLNLMNKKRNQRIEEGSVGEISDSIDEIVNQIGKIEVNLGHMVKDLRDTDKQVAGCIQKYGLVRFDAFTDVGGEQSFALALLDNKNTGLILSNIYGRQDSRMYVKQMVEGQSDRPLSDEEKSALELALRNEKPRVAAPV